MIKMIEAIAILALLLFSFFVGVKYSDQVKSRASWMFENKDEEIALPDLSNEENNGEIGAPTLENQDGATNNDQLENNGEVIAPMDNLDESEPATPITAPTQQNGVKTTK